MDALESSGPSLVGATGARVAANRNPLHRGEPRGTLAVVVKGYPRLSETFIAQELRSLEARGYHLEIVSLRRPTDRHLHPVHREIVAPVTYLPEYLHDAPIRVLRAWWKVRRLPGYAAARRQFLADLRRDLSRNRIRRLGQAFVLAAHMKEHPHLTAIYAHFLHTPSSVAHYAAVITGRPWACSAHAKDIWTTPDWEIREKLGAMRWLSTCTASGARRLRALAPDAGRVHLTYHGLDLDRFPPPQRVTPRTDKPVTILSVGRLVPKKGYDVLLRAFSMLDQGLDWRFVHIGGGTLATSMRALSESLGLSGRVEWRGAQPQETVLAAYRDADLFVLASRIADDGDRDGLPNVIVEAQSQALPVVATDVSAIPELIEDGHNGVLVSPDDPAALADALTRLILDPVLRIDMGRAGDTIVRSRFDHAASIGHLVTLLDSLLVDPQPTEIAVSPALS